MEHLPEGSPAWAQILWTLLVVAASAGLWITARWKDWIKKPSTPTPQATVLGASILTTDQTERMTKTLAQVEKAVGRVEVEQARTTAAVGHVEKAVSRVEDAIDRLAERQET